MVLCQLVSQRKPSYAKKAYPNQAKDPQAEQTQRMMKFMIIFMTVMMVFMSFRSGTLALYWIIGNLYTIVQTTINRKTNEIKWEKAQSTNTITGVKVKVQKPVKEKKLKPPMAPKSKSKAVADDEEKVTDLTKDDTLEEFNNKEEEIVDADYEEIEENDKEE